MTTPLPASAASVPVIKAGLAMLHAAQKNESLLESITPVSERCAQSLLPYGAPDTALLKKSVKTKVFPPASKRPLSRISAIHTKKGNIDGMTRLSHMLKPESAADIQSALNIMSSTHNINAMQMLFVFRDIGFMVIYMLANRRK